MSSPQQEQQHYCINITLTREFLKWTHTHRLVEGPNEYLERLWNNKPAEQQFSFGGKYGTQFKTLEELQSFNTAFDKLLSDKSINPKHKHPLFYLITFLGNDVEQQSKDNNRHNHLHDYAIFILNLIADSLAHIEAMRKNPNYQEVYDELTNELFFAKHEVVASMPYNELIEYYPDPKQADDVIKYLRIPFYDYELYVPNDIIISIQSNKNRKLKTLEGTQVNNFELPKNIQRETFIYMIKTMLDYHKRYNTEFYQDLIKGENTFADYKKLINKNKKHSISYVTSLVKVGVLVTDYLIKHKIYTSKRSIAGFLFEYFALFKAIVLKRPLQLPNDYSELIPFYIKNRVNGETIRNMMKDVGEI